jgi:hypothetical protein
MNASLELVEQAFLLRVHPDGGGFGSPFLWCCVVVIRGDTAEIKGAMGAPPAGGRRAIAEALRERGVSRVIWERIRDEKRKVSLGL